MADQTGLRKDPRGYVVATTPDFCKTAGGTPVPYPIFAQFSWAIQEVPTVRFEGRPATNLNARISRVVGDEAGVGGGVTSQVFGGMCRPVPGTTSPTFRVGGQWLIHSDQTQMFMNCAGPDGLANTVGQVTWSTSPPSGVTVGPNGEILGVTNPPVEAETEEEKGFFDRLADKAKSAASAVGDAVSGMSAMDALHLGLDVVGLVPGLGEIADGANALLYLAEGDRVNAALSAAAMIPFAGMAATGAKFARRADALAGVVRAADRAAGAAKAAGKAAGRVASRAGRAVTTRGGKILGGAADVAQFVSDGIRRVWCFSDPVDATTGRLVIDAVDIDLPGRVPLVLARIWTTGSRFAGRFGPGWTSTLDQALLVNRATRRVVVRLADGRVLDLPLPGPGEETEERKQGLRLSAEVGQDPPTTGSFGDGPPSGDGRLGAPPVLGASPSPDAEVQRYRLRFDDGLVLVFEPGAGAYWPDVERSGREWRLARIEDVDGAAVTIELNDRGLTVTDSAGRRLAVETDHAGRVVSVTGPDPGRRRRPAVLAQFAYDGDGRLVSARDAAGEPERYHHDAGGQMVGQTFRGGARFHWAYAAFTAPDGGLGARCVRAWGQTPDGRDGLLDYAFDYDLDAGVTRVTDSTGATTTLEMDADGRVRAMTDPLGHVSRYAYDSRTGTLTAATDPEGRTTRLAYDSDGYLTRYVAPDGGAWSLRYNRDHQPDTFEGPTGLIWTRAYDSRGRLATETDATGAVTHYRYSSSGQIAEIEDPGGHTTRLVWDASGGLAEVTDRTGATTRYRYDALGRLELQTRPDGSETLFVHDAAGRLTRRTDRVSGQERGPERTTRFAYDASGRVAAVTGPDGATRRYARDALFGVVTSVTEPSGATTRYEHDTEGRLASVVDATGRGWAFQRDALGRVVAETDVTGRTLRYAYDAAHRLVETTDARGVATALAYDEVGRVTGRAFAAGTDAETTEAFEYDKAGRLTRATNTSADVVWVYDALGRVVEERQSLATDALASDAAGWSVGPAVVRSVYGALGWRETRATPAGRDLHFGHDAEGRLTSVADDRGLLVEQALDAVGRVRRRAIGAAPSGPAPVVGVRAYTPFGELAEQRLVRDAGPGRVGLTEVFRRAYDYRPAGELAEVADSRWTAPGPGLGASVAFRFDADSRLASSLDPVRGLQTYAFDAAGNAPAAPVRLPQFPTTDGDVPGDDRQRVVSVRVAEGWTLGYDADGSLLTKHDASGRRGGLAWRYVYDPAGRLVETWRDDGGGEARVGRYRYDALGRRVARETWAEDGSGLAERMVWDGDVPAERQRSERAPRRGAVPATAASGTATGGTAVSVRTYAFEGFEPLALLDGLDDQAVVVECDQIGQPRLAVDRSGALVWGGQFDAWGADLAVGGDCDIDLRLPGQVADPESGLRYNRFRYYDPATRTYTQADPAGLGGGLGPHGYVHDPTYFVDPLGLNCADDARRLRANMVGATPGRVPPGYSNAAHHIVQSNSTDAYSTASRAHLQRHGIDINDADNGVFLPTSNRVRNAARTNAAPHSRVHGAATRQNVHDRITALNKPEEIRAELQKIAREFESGQIPGRPSIQLPQYP